MSTGPSVAPPRRATTKHNSSGSSGAPVSGPTTEGTIAVYSTIMVPLDIAHPDRQARALRVAGDLAAQYGAELCFVTVTSAAPGTLGHTPEEAKERLNAYARDKGQELDVKARAHLALSHDPAVDLDKTLLGAVDETGADLVVMASHVPGWADFFTGSHGGWLASHAKVSVMVVRD